MVFTVYIATTAHRKSHIQALISRALQALKEKESV